MEWETIGTYENITLPMLLYCIYCFTELDFPLSGLEGMSSPSLDDFAAFPSLHTCECTLSSVAINGQ